MGKLRCYQKVINTFSAYSLSMACQFLDCENCIFSLEFNCDPAVLRCCPLGSDTYDSGILIFSLL